VQLGKVISEQLIAACRARREGKEDVSASAVGRRLLDIVEDVGSAHGVVPKSR
jgi:hypothetical protein